MEPTVSIGSVIARERRLRGDTQQELAERLGVSKAAVSKWEVGQSIPDVTLLPRIAAYFSLTLDELFGYRSVLSNEEVATLYAELRAKAARDQSSALDRLREAVQDHYADCRLLVMMASLLFEWATVGPDPLGQVGDEVPRLAAEDGPDMLMAEAVDLLDHVINEGSDSVAVRQAARMKAATLVQLGSYAKAVALLEPVVSPQGISQVMLLVTAYRGLGRKDDAWKLMQGECLRSASLVEALLLQEVGMAEDAEHVRCAARAASVLHGALDMDGVNPCYRATVALELAGTLRRMGDTDGALEALGDAVDLARELAPAVPFSSQSSPLYDRIALDADPGQFGAAWAGHKEGQASDLVRAVREAVVAAVADPAWGSLADDERFRELAASTATLVDGGQGAR